MAALFSPAELEAFLQRPVSIGAAEIAERVVRGWLKAATGVDDWDWPVPDDVFSWAIELGAIAHENPTSLSTDTVGDVSSQWQRGRKAEILTAAAAKYGPTSRSRSLGSFPAAVAWPDPAVWGA